MISSTLNGYPILLLPPDLDAGMTARGQSVKTDDFEGDAGDMLAIKAGGLPNTTEDIAFLCKTRQELDDLESFLRSLSGRWQSFWAPTWNDDVTVIVGGAGSMQIRDIDYTASLFPSPAFGYVFVVNETDWTDWAVRFVGSATNNGDGTETLVGSYNVGGFDAATSATHRFMFVRFVRLATDDVTIEYLDGERSIVTLKILNVPGSFPPFNPPPGYTPIELSNTVSPYDPSMFIASLRGAPPGDWFTGVVADPGALTTCGIAPDPSVHCPISEIDAVRTWRTEPIDDATGFGPMIFSALAGSGGGTFDRYFKLHLGFTIRQMRAGVAVQTWNTNFRPTDWSGGNISPSTSATPYTFAAGDWLEFDLNGQAALNGGYTDSGNRPGIVNGRPYPTYAYIYGTIRPLAP